MWINVTPPQEAEGRLGRIYESIRTPDGHIDNVLQIHSLRPRTLEGHLALYKAVLHNPDIALSPRERELIGSMSRHSTIATTASSVLSTTVRLGSAPTTPRIPTGISDPCRRGLWWEGKNRLTTLAKRCKTQIGWR